MTEWQPIETAPKDGSVVDVWVVAAWGSGVRFTNVYFKNDKWCHQGGPILETPVATPTHWMERPAPPEPRP